MATDDAAATAIDPEEVGAFAQQVFGWAIGGTNAMMIDVGHRAGLFTAAAGAGQLTSDELARRANASERHVREWLGGMACAGVFTYDSDARTYELPAVHAMVLTGDTAANIAPMMGGISLSATLLPDVARTVREGGGIPYERYRPDFTTHMDQMMRRIYDATLLDGFIGGVPGLTERLTSGVQVADVGCGSGHTTNLLAREFPASTFVGLDIADDALDMGRAEAAEWGLTNVTYDNVDIADLTGSFDVVVAFDCIHDQARPDDMLAAVRKSLAPGGIFMAVDVGMSSNLEDNIANPLAPWMYGASLFHCMQVSLAEGGAGLGTCWGRQLATRMFEEAGFDDVTIHETPPEDAINAIFVGYARP